MDIKKKLQDLSQKYPSLITKNTFTEKNFNLTNTQINEFFNLLTEDGKKTIEFTQIVDIILLIEEKENCKIETKLKIDFSFLIILRENYKELKTNIGENFESTLIRICNRHFYQVDKIKKEIPKINQYFYLFFIKEKNVKDNQFCERFFEIVENPNLNKSDCFDFNYDVKYMVQGLQKQCQYFETKLNLLVNNFDFETFKVSVQDFGIFNGIFQSELNKLRRINSIYKKSNIKLKEKNKLLKNYCKLKEESLVEKENLFKKQIESNAKLAAKNIDLKVSLSKLFKNNNNLEVQIQNIKTQYSKFSSTIKKKNIMITLLNTEKIELSNEIHKLSVSNQNNIFTKKIIFGNWSFLNENFLTSKNSEIILKNKKDKLKMTDSKFNQDLNINTIKTLNSPNLKNLQNSHLINQKGNHLNLSSAHPYDDRQSIPSKNSDFSIRYSIFNLNDTKQRKKDAGIKEKNKTQPETSDQLDSLKNTRLKSKENKLTSIEDIYNTFKDYGYLCDQNKKELSVIEFEDEKITIQNFSDRRNFIEILSKRIIYVELSKKNPFLLKIIFNNSSLKKETVLLECTHTYHLLEVLKLSKYFSENLIKKKHFFELEKNLNFNFCSLNLFQNPAYCGIVRQYVNSLFCDWKVIFLVFIGKVLIKFQLPNTIYYKDAGNCFKQMVIFQLENYNLMNSKKGLNVPNIFAIKFGNNKEQDLVVSTPGIFQLNHWLDIFYNLYNNQVF